MENQITQKTSAKSKAFKTFWIATLVLVVLSLLVALFTTSFFTVSIKRSNIVSDNGASYSALVYVPKTVTNANPAPAVILVHGNSTSSTQQSSHAIELSRRGYVVISMDIAGRGQSELGEGLSDGELTPSLQTWLNYALQSPLVDKENIVMSSHSMGGILVRTAIANNPGAVSTWVANGTRANEKAPEWNINHAAFGGRYELKTETEAKDALAKLLGIESSEIEYGKVYEMNGKYYACNLSDRVHASTFWNSDNIAQLCDFIQMTNPGQNYLEGTNQIWWARDAFSMLAMISAIAFMMALLNALVNCTDFFAIIKQPLPRAIPLSKVGYAISVAVGVLVPFLFYGKVANSYQYILPKTLYLFPSWLGNGMVCFMLFTAIISVIMGVLYLKTDAKKHGAKLCDLGVTTAGNTKLSAELILKSMVLAVCVVIPLFAWMKVLEDYTGTNFQTACMGLQSITPLRTKVSIPYILCYGISFIASGFAHNVERRLPSTGNEKKDAVRQVVVNVVIGTLGIALYVLVAVLYDRNPATTSTAPEFFWGDLHTLFSYGLIWFMAGSTAITTISYRITGHIWAGAFINAIYCAWSLLSSVPMTQIVRLY